MKRRPEAEIRADDPDRDEKYEEFQKAFDASRTKPKAGGLDTGEPITEEDELELETSLKQQAEELTGSDDATEDVGQVIYLLREAGYDQEDIKRVAEQEAAKIQASERPGDPVQAIVNDIMKEAENARMREFRNTQDADTHPGKSAGPSETGDIDLRDMTDAGNEK